MTPTTETSILQSPDAFHFLTVTVAGRNIPAQPLHVYEMSMGEIADCVQELLQVASAFYSNRTCVDDLRRTAEASLTELTVEQVLKAIDIRLLTSAVSGALFVIASKSCDADIEFLRSLSPASFMQVAAAVIGTNAPFFLSLPTLFGAPAAEKTDEAAAESSLPGA